MISTKVTSIAIFFAFFCVSKFSAEEFNKISVQVFIGNLSATLLTANSNGIKVTEIIIEQQNVPILKKNSFQGLSDINAIIIRKTPLWKLEEHVFRNLSTLRRVNLNFNNIQEITDNVFSNSRLSHISLRSNGIRKISSGAFNFLPNLQVLDLSYNKIEDIPKHLFFRTGNLKTLDLSNNKLRHYPAIPYRPYSYFEQAFANAVVYESTILDLSYNNFTFISYYLLRGITLIDELRLNGNKINLISEYAFDDLKWVKKLNLADNKLEEISDTLMFNLEGAEELKMENNPWNYDFVCKYKDWCQFFNKSNTMGIKTDKCYH